MPELRIRSNVPGRALSLIAALLVTNTACGETEETETGKNATVVFKEESKRSLHLSYKKSYEFADDWFSHNIPNWRKIFAQYSGAPNLHYLEVGVYEGRSFIWMLENVLTHPTSRLTGLDVFTSDQVQQRWLRNIEKSGQARKVTTIKGYSQIELRMLPVESFDIIYVDGSHSADDVLADAIQSWALLKVGGIVVFDDYTWDGSYFAGEGRHLPDELLPGIAIDAFVETHRNYVKIVHAGSQLVLRKRQNPCSNKTSCTPIGPYTYEWKERKLSRHRDRSPVDLSIRDLQVLERILWNRAFVRGRFVSTNSVAEDPEVKALAARLGLAPLGERGRTRRN